jgi:hypothetical protein
MMYIENVAGDSLRPFALKPGVPLPDYIGALKLRRCLNPDAGMDDGNSPFTSLQNALKDSKRIKYHNGYLNNVAASIKY